MTDDTIETYRSYTDSLDTETLPRDGVYRVMAARPNAATTHVSRRINGKYHALYARDSLEDEHGHAGVTFHISKVIRCDDCGFESPTDAFGTGKFNVCPECDSHDYSYLEANDY